MFQRRETWLEKCTSNTEYQNHYTIHKSQVPKEACGPTMADFSSDHLGACKCIDTWDL